VDTAIRRVARRAIDRIINSRYHQLMGE